MTDSKPEPFNERAFRVYDHPQHDWNGRRLVEREVNHREVKQRVDAARDDSIFAVIHIPPGRAAV